MHMFVYVGLPPRVYRVPHVRVLGVCGSSWETMMCDVSVFTDRYVIVAIQYVF